MSLPKYLSFLSPPIHFVLFFLSLYLVSRVNTNLSSCQTSSYLDMIWIIVLTFVLRAFLPRSAAPSSHVWSSDAMQSKLCHQFDI